jgi:hypothetical protein
MWQTDVQESPCTGYCVHFMQEMRDGVKLPVADLADSCYF